MNNEAPENHGTSDMNSAPLPSRGNVVTGRGPIDPELRSLLDAFEPLSVSAASLSQVRAVVAETVAAMPLADDKDVTRAEVRIPGEGDAPPVRALVYRPAAAKGRVPVILEIHGGGMVIGTPEMNDARNIQLVKECGLAVVSVDYRLAPETQAPGNVEDCYAVLRWMHEPDQAGFVDTANIMVLGESAGGGLAAALALLARDRGEFDLQAVLLLSAMLDDRTGTDPSVGGPFADLIWTRDSNAFGWTSLLGAAPGSDDVSAYAVPARASDLSGLPKTFMAIGALDMFLHENLDFARRLADAGVPLELHVYPGAYHGFQMAANSGVAQQAFANLKTAIERFALTSWTLG